MLRRTSIGNRSNLLENRLFLMLFSVVSKNETKRRFFVQMFQKMKQKSWIIHGKIVQNAHK